MSPEYAMEGIFSEKSDIFSLGVLLLEILSGKRNSSFSDDEHSLNLIGYVSFYLCTNVIFSTSTNSRFLYPHYCLYLYFISGMEFME